MSADWWQNFANNFAADLAPLLALFGEQPTKQFLSETLDLVDIVIFSIAPIGVLTAVVSAIRVSEDSSLRAFIGRAQEGAAYAEAELCSSTSRDVCELYTTGGIARVFGRPQILEVINVPSGIHSQGSNAAGIHTFEEYIKLPDHPEWREIEKQKRRNSKAADAQLFAKHPNLSLNIGIQKLPRPLFFLAAALGILLQGGVLVFAALATYVYPDIFRRDDTQIAIPAFPFTFAGSILLCTGVGLCATVVERSTKERVFKRTDKQCRLYWIQPGGQVIGDQVFDSFAFSEASTKLLQEYTTSWKPEERNDKRDRTQAIKNKLLVWTAIITTCVGFVLQFLGIRTLHSSVSVAQFVVMLVMTTVRALLRTQRLQKSDNQMGDSYTLYKGHELDWLSIRLTYPTDGDKKDGSTWQIIQPFEGFCYAVHEPVDEPVDEPDPPRPPPSDQRKPSVVDLCPHWVADLRLSSWRLIRRPTRDTQSTPSHISLVPIPSLETTFLKRARLARLTGAQSLINTSIAYDSWDLSVIASRELASSLAKAIEDTMALFYTDCIIKKAWECATRLYWSIPCGKGSIGGGPDAQTTESRRVRLSLSRQLESAKSSWKADKSELEAALGLWLWSMRLKDQEESEQGNVLEENPYRIILAQEAPGSIPTTEPSDLQPNEPAIQDESEQGNVLEENPSRIIPAQEAPDSIPTTEPSDMQPNEPTFRDEDSSLAGSNLKLWLGSRRLTFRHTTLSLPPTVSCPGATVNPRKEYTGTWLPEPKSRRIFGYHLLPKSTAPGVEMNVLAVPSESSFERMCAQEIFAAFLMSLSSIVYQIRGTTSIIRSSDKVHLENQTLSNLIRNFTASGIGSEDDAFTCVVPVLHSSGKLAHSMVFAESRDAADAYRRRNEWESAEQTLINALILSFQASGKYAPGNSDPDKYATDKCNPGQDHGRGCGTYTKEQNMCLLTLCDLYRWALVGNKHSRLFGSRGALKICKTHRLWHLSQEVVQYLAVCFALCRNYKHDTITQNQIQEIRRRLNSETGMWVGKYPKFDHIQPFQFLECMQETLLCDALYLLKDDVLSFCHDPPAITLAGRNGWVMVLRNLLELGADAEDTDRIGRNYLHRAAETIHEQETFLELVGNQDYLLSRTDERERTCLHLAAEADHKDIAEVLIDRFSLDPHQWDLGMKSSFEYAVSREAVGALAILIARMVQKPSPSSSNTMWGTLMQIAILVATSSWSDYLLERLKKELNRETFRSADGDAKRILNSLCDTYYILSEQFNQQAHFEFDFLKSIFHKHLGGDRQFPTEVVLSCKTKVENIPSITLPENPSKDTLFDDAGRSILHYAIKGGNHTRIQELLGIYPKEYLSAPDALGRTPLAYAFQNGDLALTSLLSESGAGADMLAEKASAVVADSSETGINIYFQDTSLRIREIVINYKGDQIETFSPGIVPAMKGTPLAITRGNGDDIQEHVYYLSNDDYICDMVKHRCSMEDYAPDIAKYPWEWHSGSLRDKKVKLEPRSGIAALRTDTGMLRVFYQDWSGWLQEILSPDGTAWENPRRIRKTPEETALAAFTTPDHVTRIIFQGEEFLEEIHEEVDTENHTTWVDGVFIKGKWLNGACRKIISITASQRKVFWRDAEDTIHETSLNEDGSWEDHCGVRLVDPISFRPSDPFTVIGPEEIVVYQKDDRSFHGISNHDSLWRKGKMVIPAYSS